MAKTRNMGTITIMERGPITGENESWRPTYYEAPFDTVSVAEKWLQANGKDGMTYRIIRVVREVTVEVEQVTKRKLV